MTHISIPLTVFKKDNDQSFVYLAIWWSSYV